MTTSREDDALRLADMYADRVYDYRRHASPETHHDMMVFRNALEGKLRRQHAEIAELRAEVERLEGELAIAKAFHDLAVKERNFERVASSRLQSELNTARTEAERLREALQRIADFTLLEFEGPHHMALVCVETARTALARKETT